MKVTAKVTNENGRQLTLTGVRLSFVHLVEPQGFNGSDENKKYSVTALIPKTEENQGAVDAIKHAIKTAFLAQWPDEAQRPAQPHLPLRDGDKTDRDEQQGHWFLSAKSKDPVQCFEGRPLRDCPPEKFYSGCHATVQISFYAYNMPASKGVAVGLNGVAFQADGERFGRDSKKALAAAMEDLYESDDTETADELESMLT